MEQKELARIYGCCESQLTAWKKAGAPIYSPRQLLRWLADRGGRQPALFWRLFDESEVDIIENRIQSTTR